MGESGRFIRLADGRRLAVAFHGPEDGHPVLYFHGTPSARGEWTMFGTDVLLEQHGLRIIAADRPGFGESDFQPGRLLSDWPRDAARLVGDLGLARFSLLGYSGGGAYAVATGLALAAQVEAMALVAPVIHATPEMSEGLDPQGLRLKQMAVTRPRLAAFVLDLAMGLPARFLPWQLKGTVLRGLPEVDAAALRAEGRLDRFVHVLRAAFRHGGAAAAQEMALMASPWDIALGPAPFRIDIWQGERDSFGARPAMARYLAAALGTDRLNLLDEGHVSIFANHVEAILGGLAPGAATARPPAGPP